MPDVPPYRRESLWVAAVTLVGAVLRFWGAGHLGLNHFDEGIYALAGTWIHSPKGLAAISPEVIAYAPPMFPTLVGVSYLVFGVSDVSAILVSQVLGTLTIPVAAWVGRRTFGPGAGIAAAAMAAISGPHIAFSRMALTDSTFLFFFLLALGFGGRFLERPGVLRAIPFGLMVGLAQNAKYNGALTGGIVGLTALWGLIVPSSVGRKGALKAVGYGLIAAGIAIVVYLPWYRFVESQPGGYAALLRHHRGYLSGPSAWLPHWRLQTAQATALSGRITYGLGWGAIAFALAWTGGWFLSDVSPGEPRSRWSGMRFRLALLVGSAVFGLAANTPWWLALGVIPWLVVDPRPAVRVTAAGWIVMAILTPFYHPYARLWLPLVSLGWLIVAGMMIAMAERWRIPHTSMLAPKGWNRLTLPVGLAIGLVAALGHQVTVERRSQILGSPIEATDGLRTACDQIAKRILVPVRITPERLQVVGRPAISFYLTTRVSLPVNRQPDLRAVAQTARSGDYLVTDSTLPPDGQFPALPIPMIGTGPGLPVMAIAARTFVAPTPATTLLDVHPDLAFDSGDVVDGLEILELIPIVPR